MKTKITIVAVFLNLICLGLFAQSPPLVYNVENTGAAFAPPPLPGLGQLPVIDPLTDPFMWSDGSGRSTNFNDWMRRRNEIKKEIEHYEIGTKPDRPQSITATYTPTTATSGTLRVFVTVNGQLLTLTSAVALPAGAGPFPAVIGMNSPSGGVPQTVFSNRNIARITFSHNQVTTYGGPSLNNPFYRLYPDQNLDNSGQYAAWSWGVSRLIDGLELVQASLPIDLSHLAVTGCSYAGKMALFAGALDERIALTIAQESGGGGAPAWRVSEFGGDVEKLGATDHFWFKEPMFQYAGLNVPKLPHDHHELMAMIAPRALLVTGNTDFFWLSNPSCYISARAAHEVWKSFGIADRFGFYVDGGHGHCAVPASQLPAIEAFVEKFMKGNNNANTNIMTHPYPNVNYQRWFDWWGKGNPVFPDEGSSVKIWLEAECGTVGSNWIIGADPTASKGSYVTITAGLNSTGAAPANTAANQIVIPFTVDVAGTYNILGKAIGPTANDDSYWVKVDNGAFASANGLTSTEWAWGRMMLADLTVGPHILTITYREDGAKLDKILLTTSNASVITPEFVGPNCGAAPTITAGQEFAVSEKAPTGTAFGTVLAIDPDAGNVIQKWKITGGTGASAFAINAVTGELTMLNNSSLDFESATRSYTLFLTVGDGYFTSAEGAIKVFLINANDNTPVVTSGMSFALDGGTCSELGRVTATDADDTNEPGFTTFQNWQIVGGTGSGIFAIDPSTGIISIANLTHVDLNNNSYTLMVTVGDGLHTSVAKSVTVTIPNRLTVCHKGQLITVSKMAAIGHLQHGDCVGSCGTETTTASRVAISSEGASDNNTITVFPNPVTDKININMGTNPDKIRKVQVIDLAGRVVLERSLGNASTISISSRGLSAGTYLVRMQGDKIISRKIVVQ